MINFNSLTNRETFTPEELLTLVKSQGVRIAKAYARSTGDVKFAQLSRGLVLVKMSGWPHWITFAEGFTPMLESDVMDFMAMLFPETAREVVTAQIA